MSIIKFKVAAKTDVGLVRTNNEDNFQISWDLSTLPMRWVNNEIHQLGDKGCLLVVADGMGGANAGEVASQIAIDTIKSSFLPEKISNDILSSKDSINCFIKDVIILADENIKKYAVSHPETNGMGTTIVVAWLCKDKLYIGWCGDSRAYVYNPAYGLLRLTKDHSYVQQLVDSGKLSEEETFDFPDSNIITQCLSASPQKCKPETLSKPFDLSNDDIVLLCTDGLCGMIRDSEIKSILANADDDLSKTSDALISSALRASGADNATLCLLKIVNGLKPATPIITKGRRKTKLYCIVGIVAIVILALITWIIFEHKSNEVNNQITSEVETVDSLQVANIDSIPEKSRENEELDSVQSSNVHSEVAPKDYGSVGNRNNLLQGLKHGNIPSTKSETSDGGEKESATEMVSTHDIIVVKIPANKDIPKFLKEIGFQSANEYQRLNPNKDWKSLKPGDEIKVYKKKQ